uniref:Protein kinase domain-containing protein n=1 Tax=Parascaris equorum TaxID=6256 RepID=A0A914RAD3_PAREQ
MTQMRHPRIAQIYDAFSTPDNDIILVMEVLLCNLYRKILYVE